MSKEVPFHFVILAAGEALKLKKQINAQDIQDVITKDENFGVRIPLDECRLALELLEKVGFIACVEVKYDKDGGSSKPLLYERVWQKYD